MRLTAAVMVLLFVAGCSAAASPPDPATKSETAWTPPPDPAAATWPRAAFAVAPPPTPAGITGEQELDWKRPLAAASLWLSTAQLRRSTWAGDIRELESAAAREGWGEGEVAALLAAQEGIRAWRG